ncbi:death-associated protein kinase 1-like [Daphnia carinata]|uniref:death-associated protein kinase 1-like n=1 Tax=Daphnia carinata TaxID=120202 RepID=UPI00257D4AE4|nr:death-associated protein kinase 1-like [Daphnia carinata]
MKIWIDREKLLGEGGFGMVCKGKLWNSYGRIFRGIFRGREVAVKRVEKRFAKNIEEEAMLKLDHPNIVKLFHCEKDKDFMYYALELCDASLDQVFLKKDDAKKYNGPMPPPIKIFRQLATGLAYIHSEKLIHRDIKPHNILIMRKPGEDKEIIFKWSDFGLAKSVNEKGKHSWTGVRGTRTWYAPEVLKKLIKEEKAKNKEFWGTVNSDVFVLGLVFGYILLEGEHLFGSNEKEIHKNIIRNDPVNMTNIDGELRKYYENNLLTPMLEYDPEIRINSTEIALRLEYIKNKLTGKEKEFHQLCATDSSPDLVGRINDFIRLGIDVNAKGERGQNALHYLCKSNSSPNLIDAIQLLIQLGIDVNAKDNDGWNALHHLCWSDSSPNLIDAIQLLIQLGIDVNAKDDNGQNALHYLCLLKSSPHLIDAIQLLIQLGIDVNAKDDDGWNALHFLCQFNSSPNLIDAIQLLIQLGIDVNAKDIWGENALHYLCQFNSSPNLIDAIQLFNQLGIDVNATDDDGKNALHHLCAWSSSPNLIDAIRLLIRLGIDVNAKDNFGRNARTFLRNNQWIRNKDEILKLLDSAPVV